MKLSSLYKIGLALLTFNITSVWATGMVPETSVVIIEQEDGEGMINVKNSDNHPGLLITTLVNINNDNITNLLTVTPPAARVEPGKSQNVRFIMTHKTPLKTEHLGRVIFEGVPPQKKNENVVRMNVRQNLPVLIRPTGLDRNEAPWKLLTWTLNDNQLTVNNDSPYVVRLGQGLQSLPDNTSWMLPESYILPGQKITISPLDGKKASNVTSIRFAPATTWGYAVNHYDAPVGR